MNERHLEATAEWSAPVFDAETTITERLLDNWKTTPIVLTSVWITDTGEEVIAYE